MFYKLLLNIIVFVWICWDLNIDVVEVKNLDGLIIF